MKRLRWLTMSLIGTAALAMAEPPPPSPPTVTPEQGERGLAANPQMMRERLRRFGGGEGEGMLLRMLTADTRGAKELGLSEEQIKQIKESVSTSTEELKALNGRMEKAALRQAELLKADTLDETAVLKAVQNTGDLRTQIAKLRIQQVIAAHKVLTPEQRAKVREMMAQRLQQTRQRLQENGREAPRKGREAGGTNQGSAPVPPPPPPLPEENE